MEISFQKSGAEIKDAIRRRAAALEGRLERRNAALDSLLEDRAKVRSYLVRSSQRVSMHGGHGGYTLVGPGDISSEERQEVDQLCQRIHEIEQELHRLALISTHLSDGATFDLNFDDLIKYGFEADASAGSL